MTGRRYGAAVVATLALLAACSGSSTSAGSDPTLAAPSTVATSTPVTTSTSVTTTAAGGTSDVTGGGIRATTVPARVAPATPGRFPTLRPGATLPTDAECAAQVTPADEIRAVNEPFNQRRGAQKNLAGPYASRVTGDFVGTTDEILQWVSCKWGIDTDIVRAQAAKESYWLMDNIGDWATDAAVCPPGHGLGADGRPGQCPESLGMLQVRWQYNGTPAGLDTWPEVVESTAYHVDYTYSYWRSCYEGVLEWLNTVDRVGTYAAGDEWGCVGIWFAGRWYTGDAQQYIDAVQEYARDRIWMSGSFKGFER